MILKDFKLILNILSSDEVGEKKEILLPNNFVLHSKGFRDLNSSE